MTALVECSTTGVGRRADLDLAVSRATSFLIVVPTGSSREPWIEGCVRVMSDQGLEDWRVRELITRLNETDFQAGWIKLSAGADGLTPLETRVLGGPPHRRHHRQPQDQGRVVMDRLDIIEAEGYRADRFISIHTQ